MSDEEASAFRRAAVLWANRPSPYWLLSWWLMVLLAEEYPA